MDIFIYAGIFLVVVALILSGKLRVLISGFFGLFIQDVAKTPEGAAAVYNEAIAKATNDYAKANNMLQRVSGELKSAEDEKKSSENKLKLTQEKCERFAQNDEWEKVKLFSAEVSDLTESIADLEETIKNLKAACEESKMINTAYENKLTKLKSEKNKTIDGLRRNNQLKAVYDDMNELKSSTDIDKLLGSVKEGLEESKKMATGAGVVHNNRTSTKIAKADEDDKSLKADEYVNELKAKYAKKVK